MDTISVALFTLKILAAILYLGLAVALSTRRVFTWPLRWFLVAQGLTLIPLSQDVAIIVAIRVSTPGRYLIGLIPVLASFPLLWMAARKVDGDVPPPQGVLGATMLTLGIAAIAAGVFHVPWAAVLLPGPGAPPITAAIWAGWHISFVVAALARVGRGGGVERKTLRALSWWALLVLLVSAVVEQISVVGDFATTSLLLAVLPYGFIGVLLARVPRLFEEAASRYAGSDLDSDSAADLAARAAHVIESKGLWRTPDLTLSKLAEWVAASPRDLSQAINQTYSIGFPAWINGYRLDEAESLLRNPDWKVADTAFDVGFQSLSSFNAAFRKRHGQTPSTWRRKLTDS